MTTSTPPIVAAPKDVSGAAQVEVGIGSKAVESHLNAALSEGAGGRLSPFKADLARYPKKPWLKEQSLWAVAIYRFGRWNDSRKSGITRGLLNKVYWLAYRIVETLTGITMPKMAEIGPGL